MKDIKMNSSFGGRMIKTVIVDDEPWVCKVIEKLVNWEALGFEIVGEAHDG